MTVETQNSVAQRLVRQFRVTKSELFYGPLFISALLFWSWFGAFRAGSSSITQLESLVEGMVRDHLQKLSDMIESSLAATDLFTALAWSIVGLIVYLLVWTIQTLLMGTRQTAAFAFSAVHPRGFDMRRYIVYSVIEKLSFVLMVAACLVVGIAWAQKIIPGAISLYITMIKSWQYEAIGRALLATIGVLLGLHVLIVLMRLMTGRYYKM